MAKRSLLLVDADVRSLRVLEVSLRKAGYNLATCASAKEAIETLEFSTPDLILTETRLPDEDGFAFVTRVRAQTEWATIPIIFLSSDASVESKVSGLKLGVEDYLTKPIYTKEILARIHLALSRQERDSFARARPSIAKTRFAGSLEDMGLVDLLQTIDMSRKSGVLELRSDNHRGTITFRDGQVLDAELGAVHGERAIYRLLLWNGGEFDIEFRPVRAEQTIQIPTQSILMEGMRRVDEWGRLLEQIPPLDTVMDVAEDELLARLAELPDELNPLLRAIDGERTLAEVLDAVEGDDLDTLLTLSKLFFEGIVQPSKRGTTLRPGPSDEEELVPAQGLEGRANPDGPDPNAHEGVVPRRASMVPPASEELTKKLSDLPPPMDLSPSGTAAAEGGVGPIVLPPAASLRAPAVPTEPRIRSQTLAGFSDPDGRVPKETSSKNDTTERAGAATGSAAPSKTPPPKPSGPEGLPTHDEDAMAKKNKKHKGASQEPSKQVKVETQRASEAPKEAEVRTVAQASAARGVEVTSNVIQFPAQAKRGVSAMAVNDDAGVDDSDHDSDVEDAALDAALGLGASDEKSTAREDATETKAKTEARPAEDAKASSKQSIPPKGKESIPPAKNQAKGKESIPPAKNQAKGTESVPPADEKRARKGAPSESGEVRALGTGEHQEVTEEFFAKKAPADDVHDDFSDLGLQRSDMAPDARRWMMATVTIFLAAALAIGGYLYFQRVHMPQPVVLGRGGPVELPRIASTPAAAITPTPPREAPPTPEPSVEPNVEPSVEAEGLAPAIEEPLAEQPVEGEALAAGEPAPVEGTPEAAPEAAPVEAAPVEPAPVAAAPEAAPVEAVPAAPAPIADPGGESYESLLAQAQAARGAARQAPLYERAIAANPAGAAALSQLSYILLNRGGRANNERARELAQRATGADPSDGLAWLVLGAARDSLGDRPGARQAYQACVEQGQGPHVRECRLMAR